MSIISTQVLSRNPHFRSFLVASTVSLLGSNIFDLAMPLSILQKTHSVMALSLINLAINLPYFVMAPVTGYIVDHFDKRRVMLASDIGQALCMIGLILSEWLSPTTLWPIAILVFVTKTLMILFDTVVTFQLIPALVDERGGLSDANTWFLSSHRFIQIVGPLIGGSLLALFGIIGCITANLLTFGATLFYVYRLKGLSAIIDGDVPQAPAPFPTPTRVIHSFRESVSYIWKSPLFRPFVFLMFFWNLSSLCPNTPSMIYYFTEVHSFSSAEYGAISAGFGMLGILGFLSSGYFYKELRFHKTFLVFSAMHTFLAVAGALLFKIPALFTLFFATSRFSSSVVSMGTFLLRQTRVPKHRAGAVNACLRMLFMSAVPLSSVIQGAIIHRWGVGLSWWFGAACLIGMYYFSREVSRAIEGARSRRPQTEKAA
ncbi:MAG: MFS transporter [Deltaproteobacteria bacterium]|nr:MFS transporter [Deltaproteobacteria bacterium]